MSDLENEKPSKSNWDRLLGRVGLILGSLALLMQFQRGKDVTALALTLVVAVLAFVAFSRFSKRGSKSDD